MERGYSERMVRTQILKARGESRDSLLERGNTKTSDSKLTFNITYYPAFQNVRSILEELQILLAPDKEHEKIIFLFIYLLTYSVFVSITMRHFSFFV